jgi:arylsulfatase A
MLECFPLYAIMAVMHFQFAVVALLACFSAVSSPGAPNIVLFFADDLGYGDLSVNGNPNIRTENLDRMAAEGLRMTSFYSAPSCVPARTQLMLGRYPSRVDLGGTSVGGTGGIPDDEITLAQALKSLGYRTAMVGKWHLGYQQKKYLPVGKGFDQWFGLPYSNDMQPPWVRTDIPLRLYRNAERIEQPVDQDELTVPYTENAVDFIKNQGDDPFFLYMAYNMPHLPIHTAKRFQGRSRAGLLGDVIETIDWSVGEVLRALYEAHKVDDTIVVFTSDNGPWLNLPARMLAGGVEPWHAGSPGPFRGAKHTTYEGGVRMPAIVRWPNHIPAGSVSAEMAATLDLYSTLIQAAGGDDPKRDGFDLMPLWTGASKKSPRNEFLYHRGREIQAIRLGNWKLRTVDGDELFDLELDPSERYNRAEAFPDVVADLKGRIENFQDSL